MKKGFLKRAVSIVISAAMVFSLTACGNGNSAQTSTSAEAKSEASGDADTAATDTGAAEGDEASGEQVTINLWSQFSDPNSTDGNYVAFYNALESIKTDMPNINVVHEGTESESYKVKLKTAMAGNELPDVFFNWGAGTMKPYVDAGLVLPLDEYMTDDVKGRILDYPEQ